MSIQFVVCLLFARINFIFIHIAYNPGKKFQSNNKPLHSQKISQGFILLKGLLYLLC